MKDFNLDEFRRDLAAVYRKHGVHIQAYEMEVVELTGEYNDYTAEDALKRWSVDSYWLDSRE